MRKLSAIISSVLALTVGCAEDAPDDQLPGGESSATLTIEGNYSVVVGDTLSIAVTTNGGTDASYTYESANLGVASVSDGTITGLAAGETVITVTGDDTGASGVHPVVVSAAPIDDEVPFLAQWQSSAHSDQGAEAFRHWDEDGEIPSFCAKCHSEGGFRDYLGDDGSAAGSVDSAAELGTVVNCNTCHNATALEWDTVAFPTDTQAEPDPITVSGLGREAVCMECHQGRSSTPRVNEDIADADPADDDTVDEDLGFVNPHYYPAAATLFASQVMGGYQYDPVPGSDPNVYDARFRHVPNVNTCTDCHNAHTTQIQFDTCTNCHAGATDLEGARNIRMSTSSRDFDGDGNSSEGIYYEIQTLRETLFSTIVTYAAQGGPDSRICYNNTRYPYFFIDDDLDGVCPDDAERYDQWTARLVKAAYNYLLATTERGGFAHNAKYIIQLLVDSIRDLNEGIDPLSQTEDVFTRTDIGHFNGASEAARHWDEGEREVTDQEVEGSCSACHSGSEGYRFYTRFGFGEAIEVANGLDCYTCHETFGTQPEDYSLYLVESTQWPGGAMSMLPGNDNLCANCHAGRASTASYDERFSASNFEFSNIHYNAGAGHVYGTEEKIGYEYSGETYAGRFDHAGISTAPQRCTSCHDPAATDHTFLIADAWDATCSGCHNNVDSADQIVSAGRFGIDFDGDGVAVGTDLGGGDVETPADELAGLGAQILEGLGNAGICFGSGYPYFFLADPANDASRPAPGVCVGAEGIYPNGVSINKTGQWGSDDAERQLNLTAAHNYLFWYNSPGAYAHNFTYVQQLMWDSACRLGTLNASAARAEAASVGCTP